MSRYLGFSKGTLGRHRSGLCQQFHPSCQVGLSSIQLIMVVPDPGRELQGLVGNTVHMGQKMPWSLLLV